MSADAATAASAEAQTGAPLPEDPPRPGEGVPRPARNGAWMHRGAGRLELFSRALDAERHHGRDAARRAILALDPAGGELALRAIPHGRPGVFWGLVASNGLTVAIRCRDFASVGDALRDAEALLTDLAALRAVPVHDPATGLRSIWVTRGGRVVLVAGRSWRSAGATPERALNRVLRPPRIPAATR